MERRKESEKVLVPVRVRRREELPAEVSEERVGPEKARVPEIPKRWRVL